VDFIFGSGNGKTDSGIVGAARGRNKWAWLPTVSVRGERSLIDAPAVVKSWPS
jgi:hypothetical protein